MRNIVERPVVINKKIEIRPMMYLALSYDHRIIDGKEAVSFLKIYTKLVIDILIKKNLQNMIQKLLKHSSGDIGRIKLMG